MNVLYTLLLLLNIYPGSVMSSGSVSHCSCTVHCWVELRSEHLYLMPVSREWPHLWWPTLLKPACMANFVQFAVCFSSRLCKGWMSLHSAVVFDSCGCICQCSSQSDLRWSLWYRKMAVMVRTLVTPMLLLDFVVCHLYAHTKTLLTSSKVHLITSTPAICFDQSRPKR